MAIFFVIMIAVSLSMDAFSLSLAYGTQNISKKNQLLLSIIVGIYHFIMPLLGMKIGQKLLNLLPLNPEIVVFIVLLIIGSQMIIETFKEEKTTKNLKFNEMILFGLAVSLDSFSVGIGLNQIYKNIYVSATIFSISSLLFTYIGLIFGSKIHDYIGKISTVLGGITLIIIGIIYLI